MGIAQLQLSPSSITEAGMALGLLIIAVSFPWSDLNRKANLIGSTLLIIAALWILSHSLEIGTSVVSFKAAMMGMQLFWGLLAMTLWLTYIIQYSASGKWRINHLYMLFGIMPLLVIMALVTNNIHRLLWAVPGLDIHNPYLPLQPVYGPLYWVCMAYIGALVACGGFLVLRKVIQQRNFRRWEPWVLILAAIIPLTAAFLEILGITQPAGLTIGITPFFSGIGVIALVWTLPRFRLQKVIPIARDTVFERIGDGVVVLDMQNRVVDLNPAAERLAGYSSSEALGLPVEHFWPTWSSPAASSEPSATIFKELVLTQDETQRAYDLYIYTSVDHNSRPVNRVALLIEATERKQAETMLKESEERYRTLFESAVEGILITDIETMKFIDANPAICALLGYSQEELTKMSISDIHPKTSLEHVIAEFDAQARGDKILVSDIPCLKKDGTIFYSNINNTRATVDGIKCNIGFFTDITARKQAEEKIAHLASFPELNPNSVIELYLDGSISYSNVVTMRLFPDLESLGIRHPYLVDWQTTVSQLMASGTSTLDREVQVGDSYYIQSIQYIESLKAIRIYGRNITERKQAEENLKQETDLVSAIVDTAQTIILVLDKEGRILRFNAYTAEISGYQLEEAQGKDWFDTFIPGRNRANTRMLFGQAIKGRQTRGNIDVIVTKDGRELYIEWNDKCLKDTSGNIIGLISIGQDVTERKKAEEALDSRNVLLASLIESPADILIFSLDRDYRYTAFNESHRKEMRKIWNANIKVGANLLELMTKPEVRGLAKQSIDRTFSGESFTEEQQQPDYNIYYEFNWSPIREKNGEIIGCTAFIRDITEFKKAEEEKHKLEEKAQITSRLAAVGEMAAGIAHEINNPLTGVIGFSELLAERQDLPADVKEELKIISDGSNRVKDIVKRMLTFARQNKPMKISADINELIEATLNLRLYVLRTTNIEVIKHLDPNLPWITVDPGQIQQVFLNLIVNAEYAMKKAHGKGILTITTEKMDDHIHISFKDDGMGMSQETKGKLFNPFFTTKEVGEGTGLGLSLSRSIIIEHGGTIEVESEIGKGTTFIIMLPLTLSTDQVVMRKPRAESNTSPENFRSARILVVDDEEAIRKLISTILIKNGHAVDVTGDYLDVFEKLRTKSYDAILTDIRMPGMSGVEQYELIIKAYPGFIGKFIFITGGTSDSNTRDFLEKNKLSYISKPFDRETLLKKVDGILMVAQG